jgi:hypothetical protein
MAPEAGADARQRRVQAFRNARLLPEAAGPLRRAERMTPASLENDVGTGAWECPLCQRKRPSCIATHDRGFCEGLADACRWIMRFFDCILQRNRSKGRISDS